MFPMTQKRKRYDKQIKIDNLYRQREFYFSTSNVYTIFPWWHVSAGYDFLWNTLNADVYGFAKPDRYTNMLAAATAVDLNRFAFQGSVLATFIMRQFFLALPKELEEAARVDGLGRFGTYFRIGLPLARPAVEGRAPPR